MRGEAVAGELKGADQEVEQSLMIAIIMKGLPDNYEIFKAFHETQKQCVHRCKRRRPFQNRAETTKLHFCCRQVLNHS